MSQSKKKALGLSVGLLVLIAIAVAILAPNFKDFSDFSKLSAAEKNFRKIIEAEDEHYQKTGAYFPLEIDSENLSVKRILGQSYAGCRGCEFAVEVSGLAFTAEVRVPLKDKTNYLGYVRAAPGMHIGVVGKMGVCAPEGIYAGSRRLVNVVGPCSADSWKTLFVAAGTMKRLAIETLPSDASISVDGVFKGNTTSFHSTISDNYGYLFIADLPNSPINVVVSKVGYSTASFTLDWNASTYHATVPLQKDR